MSRTLILIPAGPGAGLTSVTLGVVRAMEQQGMRLSVFKPVTQTLSGLSPSDHTCAIVKATTAIPTAESFPIHYAEHLIGLGQQDVLIEEIIGRFQPIKAQSDVVLIEGLVATDSHPFIPSLNQALARNLNAEIILVLAPGADSASQLRERLDLLQRNFAEPNESTSISGVIFNKLNAPVDEQGRIRPDLSEMFDDNAPAKNNFLQPADLQKFSPLPVIGCIPWSLDLIAIRAIDLACHLKAEIVNSGEILQRRIRSVTFCARSLPNMLDLFKPGALLVTSADRPDVLVAACLAAMNGIEIGAILMTGGYSIDPVVRTLCQRALQTGLPVFLVPTNTWQTALNLRRFSFEIPVDDLQRIEQVQNYVASHIQPQWIQSLREASSLKQLLSPPAFRFQLTELARKAKKTIVLPEGDEPRTIKAAVICAERKIARCVLLGNREEILRIAAIHSVQLTSDITIVDPQEVIEGYIGRLVDLRKNKGMTALIAREQLQDNVVLWTLMLEAGEVEGLVSGAVHTTANTIRPALQLIKTAPGSSLVSSVFFMLLPRQVLVYGDCAINPEPDAKQLAEIAIQSADSAKAFGIEPRVAMISYSTGSSGTGSDVDKVREATQIAQSLRPDLIIDGPLQYDAAIMEDVAKSKAPDSQVAGRATVFIFPDLNTGNTTYKAVQRSANLISIGPMLQGMRKPVNDLSRGALVDDIVYTIALTAIQAANNSN